MRKLSTAKKILSVTFGLLFAVLAIGILPFLLIFSFVDMNGLSEAYPPPFFILPKFLRDRGGKEKSDPK
jgi:hypothetical protein